ncbi:single-strand selective monofunctional uracil DNA glycosylase-like [Hyalella azteca]|uniref:Single-strand selective monofunctional uracil DNA glycosylase-like n=1 Tax=Hyalella azteca TaxID=294128 RepID=A0A8B7P4W7_HYAAZ|nr:single-strand selective monofunctional uracil DNA glycosylase-like [Hyalella azteca]
MDERNQVATDLLNLTTRLSDKVMELHLPNLFGGKVAKRYDPVNYARQPYQEYLNKFFPPGQERRPAGKKILFLGMNPGWGAAQTGVPFCESDSDCQLLSINCTEVGRPKEAKTDDTDDTDDNPFKNAIRTKCENRLWKLLLKLFDNDVKALFSSQLVFVHYYCPVMLLDSEDKYLAVKKLQGGGSATKAGRRKLESLCDEALREVVKLLCVTDIVAVGKYPAHAAQRSFHTATKTDNVKIHRISHPDNNKLLWNETVEKILRDAQLL